MAVITYSTAHPDEGEDRWSLTGGCCEYVFLDGLGHPTEIPDIADHEFKDAGHSPYRFSSSARSPYCLPEKR
jgi:hypothetical protein